ncbi:MAG: hypothetical protein WAN27_07875, partial [Xanthobacteraceae bacterium]
NDPSINARRGSATASIIFCHLVINAPLQTTALQNQWGLLTGHKIPLARGKRHSLLAHSFAPEGTFSLPTSRPVAKIENLTL